MAEETPDNDCLLQGLRRHGNDVECVHTGAEALEQCQGVDLVLLDPDLPDRDGLEICSRIRNCCDLPIIGIADRGSEVDRVLGLKAGLDDYLVRPYGFPELLARIEAVMRRARPQPPEPITEPVISRGSLRIDARTREIHLRGMLVPATRKEFDLLYLLASQPGTVVSRKQIMYEVWDDDWTTTSRTVDTHVSSIRSKLGARTWIITVRGVGFRFGWG